MSAKCVDDDFAAASAFVSSGAGRLSPQALLSLYGFFKIATSAPGADRPPPAGMFSSLDAKRSAWESAVRTLTASPLPAGSTLPSAARAAYVKALDGAAPGWRGEGGGGGGGGEGEGEGGSEDEGDGGGGGGDDGGDGGGGALGVYVLSRPLAAPEPAGDTLEALKRDLHFCAAKGLVAELTAALRALGGAAAAAAANAPLAPSGETLLHVAADAGSGGAVAALLAAGAAADAREPAGGQTALHYACALGRWEAAAALLAGGADAALRDIDGLTAAGVAEEGAPPELLAALQAGAEK
jgi:hypothetical protein